MGDHVAQPDHFIVNPVLRARVCDSQVVLADHRAEGIVVGEGVDTDDSAHGQGEGMAWGGRRRRDGGGNGRRADDENETEPTRRSGRESVGTFDTVRQCCRVILTQGDALVLGLDRLIEYDDDVTLIEHVVNGIIERERGKGLLRDDFFTPGGLREWLGLIAFETYQAGFAGVPRTELMDFAEFFLADGLTEENQDEALTTLLQFPLFAPGTRAGMLTFKHELLAEHLAGGHLLGEIASRPESVARDFGARIDLARSLIGRCVARLLPSQPNGMQAVMNALRTETVIGRAFANLLQILLMASPARDILKSSGINLEGHDLKHVVFEDKDLTGLSFRGCDLTSTEFSKCDMKQACLEAAILSGTRFDKGTESLFPGARFGGLERFESVYAGRRRIDDHRQMIEWTQRVTGVSEERLGPCPAALQLKALFLKYVYPDGSGRRNELKRDALRRGKRCAGGPGPEKCVDRCLSFGFLQGPDSRDRIRRAPGETYTQMVEYVRDWRLAPNIAQLLSSLCTKINCKHVPGATPQY